MSALIWCAIALGYTAGILGGVALLLWLGAKEGYMRGYYRVIGPPSVEVEDDDGD